MSFTLTLSNVALVKAGAYANSTITLSNTILSQLSDEAEAMIFAVTRKDWVADYSSVKTNAKQFLSEVASSHIAMQIINYDMGVYTSRAEAQTMLDILDDKVKRGLQYLSLQETKDAIKV